MVTCSKRQEETKTVISEKYHYILQNWHLKSSTVILILFHFLPFFSIFNFKITINFNNALLMSLNLTSLKELCLCKNKGLFIQEYGIRRHLTMWEGSGSG